MSDKELLLQLIHKNESEANLTVAKLVLLLAAIYLFTMVVSMGGVFRSGTFSLTPCFFIGAMILSVCAGICFVRKGNGKWLKYMMLIAIILSVCMINIVIGYKAWLGFAFPIIISCRYQSTKATFITGAIASFFIICSAFVNAYLAKMTGFVDLNMVAYPEGANLYIKGYPYDAVIEHGFNEALVLKRTLKASTFPSMVYISIITASSISVVNFGQRKIIETAKAVAGMERNKMEAEKAKILQKQKEELESAYALAEAANRAKTTFLNNMSHDIRTPMNAIIGFTTLAQNHIDKQEQVLDYLDKISVSSEYLMSLMNDVLDMSRIESGGVNIEEREIYLPEIFTHLSGIVQPSVNERKLNLVIEEIDVKDEYVYADDLRLNQVLLNIVGNAIKFTPEGGNIHIGVVQKPTQEVGIATYEFHIKDTGIGMNKEFCDHIFEPFSREKTATVSGISGTGLGMAIAKNIVDMMAGEISVESKAGVGTEFVVTLSLRTVAELEKVLSDVDLPLEVTSDSSTDLITNLDQFKDKKLLLVEDNIINQEIAVAILSEAGFDVEIAGDGSEAVELIKEKDSGYYELVLMDIQMPFVDGYEATRQIRSIEDLDKSNISIVAMTADVFEEDKQKALQAGMNGYISKPIDIPKMMGVVAQFMV